MKREILFRGKRTDGKGWIEGNLFYDAGLGEFSIRGYDLIPPTYEEPGGDARYYNHVIDPDTIGQFTGLVAEGGNRLFEGDIVTCNYFKMALGANSGVFETDAELTGVIAFNDLSLVVEEITCEKWEKYTGYKSGEGECEFTNLHDVYEDSQTAEMSIEIIGNIHDNPELLKPQQ